MGIYRIAEVCPNGHVSTSAADRNPELREKYCSLCGEATLTACPKCTQPIRGYFHVDGVISAGSYYEPPSFCHACGNAFPWTERKISGAIELLQAGSDLTPTEIEQVRSDLSELTKDSPKTPAASLRFKKVLSKVGATVASGVKDIIVDILSEATKKAIWG